MAHSRNILGLNLLVFMGEVAYVGVLPQPKDVQLAQLATRVSLVVGL